MFLMGRFDTDDGQLPRSAGLAGLNTSVRQQVYATSSANVEGNWGIDEYSNRDDTGE